MSKECYSKKAGGLIKKLELQDVPRRKATNLAYVKRSIELAEEGWKNTVVFGEAGDIAAAAAYEAFEGGIRIETFGSIGKFEKGITPGMSALYDIMKVAEKTKTGRVHTFATAESIDFYEKFGFKSSKTDGRSMYVDRESYINYIDYYESLPEFTK